MKKIKEQFAAFLFGFTALASVLCVILICVFLFASGIPAMREIGVLDFLTGRQWAPGNVPAGYGIFTMIIGSIYVTAGAILIGVPVGILTAVYLSYFCSKRVYKPLKAAVELLAGIPSVVYGFFGMIVLVPVFRSSLFTAAVLLGIMILPTIISISESAIAAVPKSYYEGAMGLGASHERSVFFSVLPAAKSGILAGVILGVGRALGETMAVVMVAGNQALMPRGLFKGVRTLTANIVLEMGYAEGLHREALIATAVVLFVLIMIINIAFSCVKRRGES